MGKSNFAVFVDLENVGAKESMLRYIIEKVKIRGDILLEDSYLSSISSSQLQVLSILFLFKRKQNLEEKNMKSGVL